MTPNKKKGRGTKYPSTKSYTVEYMQVPATGLGLLEWNADGGRNIRRYATCDAIYQGCHH